MMMSTDFGQWHEQTWWHCVMTRRVYIDENAISYYFTLKKIQFLSTKAQTATQNHKGFWAWMQLEERWGCGALLLCCVCLSAWLYYVGDVPLQICHLVSADHTAERRLNLPLWKSKYTPTRNISQMFLIKRGKKRKTKLESVPSRILSCCYVTGVFWVIAAVLLLDTKISK